MDDATARTAEMFGAAIDARLTTRHTTAPESRPLVRVRERAEGDGPVRAERTLLLTPASSIAVRPVRWLWTDRLALGTVSLLGGREGVVKTILGYTHAAD